MKNKQIFTSKEKKIATNKYLSDLKMIDEIKILIENNHRKSEINKIEKIKNRFIILWSDYGLAEEEVRILKTHFKISPEQWRQIINKYRLSPDIEEVLRLSK